MTMFSHHRPRRSRTHPHWCDVSRCLSAANHRGEHRSAPLRLGPVTLTMVRPAAGREHLETWSRTPLIDRGDGGQAHAARLVFCILTVLEVTRLAVVDHARHTGSSPRAPRGGDQ